MNNQHITIIAEAGVNHCGNLDMALRLVDAAADAGVNYVKFQTFKSEALVSGSAPLAKYQSENIGGAADSQLAMLRRLELSEADHREIIRHCEERGVKFLSTAFDLESIEFLASLGLDFWKIPSGEITNYPYLRAIARHGGRIVMSTGMSTIDEISQAVDVLVTHGAVRENITLLHCNTQYPTPMEDVNLLAMTDMRRRMSLKVGYSDHTLGIEVPIAAAALGATVIEKHFTLDKSLPGPDHKASLSPDELKAMVKAIRNISLALGDGAKRVSPSELENKSVARKSIVAAVDIKKGELLMEENLTTKRPGTGLNPMLWPAVIGTRAVADFPADTQIRL